MPDKYFELHKAHPVEAWACGRKIGMVIVSDIGNGQWLKLGAADDFRTMQVAAALENITIKPNSGHREHAHQIRLRTAWEAKKKKLQEKNGKDCWLPPAPAQPGWSSHERAEAVDINRSHDDPDGPGPETGPTDKWLAYNAHRFNFYRTVERELWHWEWVLKVY